MRILAIRGCNLASLAGEFEIDLARAPFSDAGVFAIVGNTGAGKSTLLDALCVALFDRTPRLTNHSRVVVGRGDGDPGALGAQDVRTLLRRGAATGWAEVDFEARDARRYRARWSVRRARGQTDGTLQDQQITLTALDGDERHPLGGTKTETLKAIVARLGLTFDQFRRSALLAQGEFAAFLRADGKDRSELLERMTGTEIYTKLSVAAHLRASLAEQRLRDTRAQADAIPVLADDARAATEAELVLAREAQVAARARLAAAEAEARWRDEHGRLRGALADADREHAGAITAAESAEADRAELALRRRAEQLRPAWEEVARLDRATAIAHGEVARLDAALATARAHHRGVAARHAELAALRAPIRAACIAARITVPQVPRPTPAAPTTTRARATRRPATDGRARTSEVDRAVAVAPDVRTRASTVDGAVAADVRAGTSGVDLAVEVADDIRNRASTVDGAVAADVRAGTSGVDLAVGVADDIRNRASTVDGAVAADVRAGTSGVDLGVAADVRAGTSDVDLAVAAGVRAGPSDVDLAVAVAAWEDVDLAVAAADAAWLTARAALAPEVAAWEDVEARFEQHRVLVDAIAAIDALTRDHDATRARLGNARAAAAADHATAVARLAEAQRKAASFHQRRGLTLDAARRQEDEARARLADVERLVSIAAVARGAARVRAQVDHQLAELAEQAATDREQRARVEAERGVALALREERSRILDELRRAAGYEHARAELRDGEACPLCGATEHPWKERGAFDDVIRAESQRLAEASAAVDATRTTLAALDAREHQRARDRELLARHRETATASAAADITRWRDQLAALGELLLEDNPATAEAERIATELETSARARLEHARMVFSQTQAATKAAQEAQAEMQLAQAAVDHAHGVVADHDRRIAELDGTLHRLAGERATRSERGRELATELATTISRWRAATRPAASTDTMYIPTDLVAARGAMAELAAAWRARAARIALADATITCSLAALERDERDAERSVTEQIARHEAAAQRRATLVDELRVAAARLDTARAEAGFDADELRRLLAADPSRIDELAAKLAAIERAVERCRAVVAERRGRVEAHVAKRPASAAADIDRAAHDRVAPADAAGHVDGVARADAAGHVDGVARADAAGHVDGVARADAAGRGDASARVDDAAHVRALEAAVVEADHHAARLVAALAADADARARRAAVLAMLAEADAAAEVDRVLGDVIGSHDGKLFRSFAQSLTLDSLLAVANAHLEELAPRYQLERVPRHDLELQVIDRDLGAEVRSVQSLSGGESFLVSLALALGLSSMSAHDVRVRTLLIDEGFGTLDPATLDSALSVLDALQATGRQVGVISHVPALVERVGAHVRVVQRGGGRSEVVVA